MAFNKIKNKKKRKRQPCTYFVCVFQDMHSVKHLLLTLEAWAHLKECVPVLIPFSYSAVCYKLTFQDSNVRSFVFYHEQHWGTLLRSDYKEKKNPKKNKIKASSHGGIELKDCVGVLSMWIRIHSRFWCICLLYFCWFCFYTHIKIIFYCNCTVLFCCKHH